MKYINKFETFDELMDDFIKNIDNDYYNNHEDFVDKLYDKISELEGSINGFNFFKSRDNDFEWYNNSYEIIAKPYEENNFELALIIHDNTNFFNIIEIVKIKLQQLKSNKDVDRIFNYYIKSIEDITKTLNKREDIIQQLTKIKKVEDFYIEIKNRKFNSLEINNDEINGIVISTIDTNTIFKIYKKIEKEHPELLSSLKYNI